MKLKTFKVTVTRSERTVISVRAVDRMEAAGIGRSMLEDGVGVRLPGLISVKVEATNGKKL